VLMANQGLADILELDCPPEALIGQRLRDLLIYTEQEGTVRRALAEKGEIHGFQYHFKTLIGKDKWVIHDSFVIEEKATGRRIVEAIVKDITAIKEAEQFIAAEKEWLTVTLRSIGDGVIATDAEGRVLLLNRVAERLTGWTQEEAATHPIEEVFRIADSGTREPFRNFVGAIRSGALMEALEDVVLTDRQGTERLISETAAPIRDEASRIIGAVIAFRDITEKQRLEEEIRRSERLESLGLLAGGIAHEFNNILTAVLGNVSLAKLIMTGGNAEMADLLDEVERAAVRARDVTQQLLAFAKGGAPVKQAASLEEIVRDSATFTLRGLASRGVFQVQPDLWAAEVDPAQISQVIQNLVINADQAMPGGGIVTIGLANMLLDRPATLPLPPGRYVLITVSDAGAGIPPAHRSRIFDPYFTTKEKGSGLGLTITFSVIRKHGGHVTVESQVGKGTTFSVYLPAVARENAAPGPEGRRSRTACAREF
jgi:two-component system, cell cycle sensor histidine kinase and response regulator CckA